MRSYKLQLSLIFLFFLTFLTSVPLIGQFTIRDIYPALNAVNVSANDSIEIVFSNPIDTQTLDGAVSLRGDIVGPTLFRQEIISPSTIRLYPNFGLTEGEKYTVTISSQLRSQGGVQLNSGYQFSFKVKPTFPSTTFSAPLKLVLPQNSDPGNLLAVDLNKNMQPDIVVVNTNNNILTIFENRILRSGDYVSARELELDLNSTTAGSALFSGFDVPVQASLTAGDLNGDGFNDIVVTAPLANRIAILINDASKQFIFQPQYLNISDRPISTNLIDYDNDGDLDLIITLFGSDQIVLMENDGNGNFSERNRYATGLAPSLTSVQDFNNDGQMDLMVVTAGSQSVEIFYGQTNNEFLRDVIIDNLGYIPTSLGSDNILGNNTAINFIDFALTSREDNIGRIFRNNAGVFVESLGPSFNPFGRPTAMTTGVLSNRDRSDIIYAFNASDHIVIQRNPQNGEFINSESTVINNVLNAGSLITADLNFGGAMDIAVSNEGLNYISIYFAINNRDGCVEILDVLFGNVCVGNTAVMELIIKNQCPFPLYGTLEIESDIFTINQNEIELQANGEIRIPVQFKPEQNIPYKLDVDIDFFRDSEKTIYAGTGTFTMLGNGVQADVQVIDSIDFGTGIIGTTIQRTVEVRNTGQIPITIKSVTSSNPSFSAPASVVGIVIQPAQTYFMPINFTPTTEDDFEGVLTINFDSVCDDELSREVLVMGSGLPPLPDLVARSLTTPGLPEYVIRKPYEFTGNFEINGQPVSDPVRVGFLINDELSVSSVISGLQLGVNYSNSAELIFENKGTYTISFYVDIDNAIRESVETNNEVRIQIRVVDGELIVRPNPFTPNDDGFNDMAVFDFSGFEVFQNNRVRIYTIEGREVQDLTGNGQPTITWNGKNSSNVDQPPGVYIYQALVGDKVIKQGSVVLAR